MEQNQSSKMNIYIQISKYILATSLFIFLVGCKSEHPNPELLDPIYLDLVKAYGEVVKKLEGEEKELSKLLKELEKTAPRSMSRVTVRSDIKRVQKKAFHLRQYVEYMRIRRDRRRVEGRRSYKMAFQRNEDWPDPKEYESYKTYNKLKNISLNWNERVPKLNRKNPNFSAAKKTE